MKGVHAPISKHEMFQALFEYRTIKAWKYGQVFEIDVWCFNEQLANGIVLDALPRSGMKGKFIEVEIENIISAYDRWEKPTKGEMLLTILKGWFTAIKTKLKNIKTKKQKKAVRWHWPWRWNWRW